jgi:pyruvate ferredoxin oxidoreductase gamma subunit
VFRVRFHGRGGQGMKTAANILGSAFFDAGYEVQDAPRYGAERRGAPMTAFVRAARSPILERGTIAAPDLLVVADETLLDLPEAGVLQGVDVRTVLLVASTRPSREIRERLRFPGAVLTLDSASAAARPGSLARLSAACAGAAARLVGVIPRECLEMALALESAGRGAATREENVVQGLGAYDALQAQAGVVHEAPPPAAGGESPQWIRLRADDPSVAVSDVLAQGTSAGVKTGLWRTASPVIDYAHCSRCSWVCSTLCPDSAIGVGPDRTPTIDYDHCKGCMVCVSVCPAHAIRAVAGRDVGSAARPP